MFTLKELVRLAWRMRLKSPMPTSSAQLSTASKRRAFLPSAGPVLPGMQGLHAQVPCIVQALGDHTVHSGHTHYTQHCQQTAFKNSALPVMSQLTVKKASGQAGVPCASCRLLLTYAVLLEHGIPDID